MWKVEIIDSKIPEDKVRILGTFLYDEFANAFADIIDEDSEINATIKEKGYSIDPAKFSSIHYASVTKSGCADDFLFRLGNGLAICLGTVYIVDRNKQEES